MQLYTNGLALIVRALIPVLETAPDTHYAVEGGRLRRTDAGGTLSLSRILRTRAAPV